MTSPRKLEGRLKEDHLCRQRALLVSLPRGLDILPIPHSPHESPRLQGSLSAGGREARLHQTGVKGILATGDDSVGQEAGTDTSQNLPIEEATLRAESRPRDQDGLFRAVSLPT